MAISVIYLVLTSACLAQGGVLDWLYYPVKIFTGQSEQTSLYAIENDDRVLSSVQFEADSEYDTFLSEAQSVIDVKLSKVETCQHKVIMKIKSSCASLTEEDLAKLSVSLLNCKSSEEGGRQFICTDKMTVEECTREMDSEMWKAFRVIHDQARSLCFSVRQQLFKAMTEMVVNKLMHTSQSQLKSMKVLQDGHRMMLEQQETLREAQDAVSDSLKSHMQNLEKEKLLVKSGHDEVVKIVEGMHQKLDQASLQMDALLTERETSHSKLVKNVHKLQIQVKELLQQIDHSVQLVKEQNEEIAAKYKDAIDNLAQINSTVHYLVEILEMTQSELDAWVKWMSSILGGTGDHTVVMFALLLHLGYLLVGMVAMAFLGAPFTSRFLLLMLVPVNLLLTVNQDMAVRKVFPYTLESLDFQTLTMVIVTFTLGNLIISYITNVCRISIWANKSAKGNQFAEMPSTKRTPPSGVDAPVQSYWYKQLVNGMKVLEFGLCGASILPFLLFYRSFIAIIHIRKYFIIKYVRIFRRRHTSDPRSWWSNDEADHGKENWSKGISPSASQAYKSDIDDSSDTDGPLVIEKDDDDEYYAEVFTRRNFEKAFTSNHLQRNSVNDYSYPLLQDKLRRSSTPKNICSAICQSGQPCRNSCMNGHLLCHRHSLGIPTRN